MWANLFFDIRRRSFSVHMKQKSFDKTAQEDWGMEFE